MPVRVPAVASTFLRRTILEPVRSAVVLGTSSHAVWLLVDDDVAVVSTHDGTRLPNAVEIVIPAAAEPFASVERDTVPLVGSASIAFGRLVVDVVRWWDPRPAVPRISKVLLGAAIEGLPASVPGIDGAPLGAALEKGEPDALAAAARSLLGRGPGLTPEGDDYLAGALAATQVLGVAAGARRALIAVNRASGQLEAEATRRTTSFSAALIRCALGGHVAAPAGAFLRAISGRGDVDDTHRALMDVGHSSGPALAAGIVLGAQSLVHQPTTNIGGSP
jgi:hypothetical protein